MYVLYMDAVSSVRKGHPRYVFPSNDGIFYFGGRWEGMAGDVTTTRP